MLLIKTVGLYFSNMELIFATWSLYLLETPKMNLCIYLSSKDTLPAMLYREFEEGETSRYYYNPFPKNHFWMENR